MKNKTSKMLLVIGILFLINTIFGRYIVLPGYLASLGAGSGSGIPENVGVWYVIRYLIWAYSFKLGIFLIVIGYMLRTAMSKRRLWLYIIIGLAYISFAYVPIPVNSSLVFGIGGGIMTVLIVLILHLLSKERQGQFESNTISTDFKIAGYFFFAMATYNLCPLLGVRCFALEPEQMIAYGLQADAVSFAIHILIELVFGWIFILLSHLKNRDYFVP